MPGIKDELNKELEEVIAKTQMTHAYRNRKLIAWCIRSVITIVLYIIFWKYNWVKWSLVIVAPLSLINLIFILSFNRVMQWRANKTRKKIDELNL